MDEGFDMDIPEDTKKDKVQEESAEMEISEEALAVKCKPIPTDPSPQERREHELMGHVQFRSWCRHCVRGRGKSAAHYQQDAEQTHAVPHVSFDYVFLGQDNEKTLPILLIRDHAYRATFSHAVPCKGVEGSAYPARQTAFTIRQLG